MITSSYRPGDWFGVFGGATVLLLPGSEKGRVAALWSRIDDGAGFDEVLDDLLLGGLGALPGFVLLSGGEGPVKLLARGPVVVSGTARGEAVRVDGRDALTWVERTLDDVTSLTLEVVDLDSDADRLAADGSSDQPAPGERPDLPIVAGLVRVARVDRPARPAPAPAAPAVPEAAVPEVPDAAEPEAAEPEAAEPEAAESEAAESEAAESEAAASASGLDQPVDPPEPAWAAPTVPPPAPVPPAPVLPAPVPPAPVPPVPVVPSFQDDPLTAPLPLPEEQPDTEPDAALDEPAAVPDEPAAVPDEPAAVPDDPEPAVDDDADHDGLTRMGAKGEPEFARELPGIPGQPAAPRVVAPVARLVVSNGETVEVDRVVLIGRAPEARRFTSTDQPRLVKVPSPLHEISSTHVEVRPGTGADHGSAVVTDMGSTNGTVLDQPGLGVESLRPGIAVQLLPGATINLGDGVTIQVTRP